LQTLMQGTRGAGSGDFRAAKEDGHRPSQCVQVNKLHPPFDNTAIRRALLTPVTEVERALWWGVDLRSYRIEAYREIILSAIDSRVDIRCRSRCRIGRWCPTRRSRLNWRRY
jgi:hypothetical protein